MSSSVDGLEVKEQHIFWCVSVIVARSYLYQQRNPAGRLQYSTCHFFTEKRRIMFQVSRLEIYKCTVFALPSKCR